MKLRLCFFALCLKVRNCWFAFLSEEFEEISVCVSALSFLFVASVLFFATCLRAVGCFFSRDFSDHFPDCICFGKGVMLVFIILPAFLLGFLNGFAWFCSE